MKNRELVELLMKLDPELEVRTEGCDCIGDASSVSVDGGEIMINRDLSGDWPGKLEAEARVAERTAAHARKIADDQAARRERQADWLTQVDEWSSK